MLRENRILSINDVANHPEPPPFSDCLWDSPNLLILFFDDLETPGKPAFTMSMASRIAAFATNQTELPLPIPSPAGIPFRSGWPGIGGTFRMPGEVQP